MCVSKWVSGRVAKGPYQPAGISGHSLPYDDDEEDDGDGEDGGDEDDDEDEDDDDDEDDDEDGAKASSLHGVSLRQCFV